MKIGFNRRIDFRDLQECFRLYREHDYDLYYATNDLTAYFSHKTKKERSATGTYVRMVSDIILSNQQFIKYLRKSYEIEDDFIIYCYTLKAFPILIKVLSVMAEVENGKGEIRSRDIKNKLNLHCRKKTLDNLMADILYFFNEAGIITKIGKGIYTYSEAKIKLSDTQKKAVIYAFKNKSNVVNLREIRKNKYFGNYALVYDNDFFENNTKFHNFYIKGEQHILVKVYDY